MPVMAAVEAGFCRSAPWRLFARQVILPWALDGHVLSGEVLEIGGGSGAMASAIGRTFPAARLSVTDVDRLMVESARTRLSRLGNVSVEVADATALPFAADRFDAVTSFLMLHHVVRWADAVREIARALKPGGVFLGYDLTDSRLARWTHQADGSPHDIIAPDDLRDELTDAGFIDITVGLSARAHLMRFQACKPAGRRATSLKPDRRTPA
jgi:SAM-dependent methyltransferase